MNEVTANCWMVKNCWHKNLMLILQTVTKLFSNLINFCTFPPVDFKSFTWI